MKHLFITDLDGTLLNRESRVSDRSAAIISRLSRQGAMISVATARTPATVEPLLSHTLTTPPAIVMTGAAMWDRKTLQYINPRFISNEAAAQIHEACRSHGITPFIYTIQPSGIIHTYYSGIPSSKEQKFIDERAHLKLKRMIVNRHPGTDDPDTYPDTILIFGLGDACKIGSLSDCLRASGICSVSSYPDIFNPSISYIEIFAPGVSKASAVETLKKTMDADRLTVFGDNLNDLPMMAVADVAVAVENALPEVKKAADIVIGTNQSDAVALYLEQFAQDFE